MENTGFKGLGVTLWQRVILSYKSTLVGIAVVAAGQVIDYYANSPNKIVSTVCAVAGGLLALLKSKDLLPKEPLVPSAPASIPPKTPALMLGLLILGLSVPGMVRADPQFGGCLTGTKYADTCFGPSLSISLVQIDLKAGTVTTSVSPGIGYGMSWYTGRWYEMGASGYVTFRDTSTGQALVPSAVFSFAHYVRLGLGVQIGKGNRPFGLLGIGTGLGEAASNAKPVS